MLEEAYYKGNYDMTRGIFSVLKAQNVKEYCNNSSEC